MGAWGVKAMESDYGLDLLAVVEEKYLRDIDYKHFNVKEVTELLRNYITDEIIRENKGCSKEDVDFYIQENFPVHYDQAVMLIAECFADYYNNGEFLIDVHETGKSALSQRRITEFICTAGDLNSLLADLQNIPEPEHELYMMWKGSEYFDEWQSHIEMLCETLQTRIDRLEKKTMTGKSDMYIDYINKNILPGIDYGALQQSYETADKSYAKGILNLLHESMVKAYGGDTLRPDYNRDLLENSVVVPGVVQSRKTGQIILALLELDLSSSGEHWGTQFLCKYGVLPQSGGDLPTEIARPFLKRYIPYDYCYTAVIPNDIHIRRNKLPDGIKDMLSTFREHTAELLPSSEYENSDDESDMER